MKYASGKYALAICDICGFSVAYRELRPQIREGRDSGLRVCSTCFDPDYRPNRIRKAIDAQALRHPRPESWEESRRIHGWWPVDSFEIQLTMGAWEVL